MVLLIKSKLIASKAKAKGVDTEESSPLSAFVKLLPAEIIAFFATIQQSINEISNPSEYNTALCIGLIGGLIYVFLTRIVALTRDKKLLAGQVKLWSVLLQTTLTCISFALYYVLQMNMLSGIGSPEFTNFVTLMIGFIWIAMYAFISYFWVKHE